MRLGRRRRGARARWVGRALRLLTAFVLAMFFAQSTVSWAFPCDCLAESSESCPDDDGKKHCPCPIDCGPCCAGNALPAIPPTFASLVLPADLSVELVGPLAERAPPRSEPFEILRVPKPSRA